ncbi:MAG: 50S ribosomal protein L21 [Acidobacteriota bacterium]|nr:50S ribosomal protein L21 [Acidobacteriota bacterium]
MQAIIEAGGKQYRVQPGDTLRVASLAGDVGSEVELGRVLAVFKGDGEVVSGSDAGSVKVKATISANGRGKKVIVFKFKRKKQYKRTQGHRQDYTEVKIGEIAV